LELENEVREEEGDDEDREGEGAQEGRYFENDFGSQEELLLLLFDVFSSLCRVKKDGDDEDVLLEEFVPDTEDCTKKYSLHLPASYVSSFSIQRCF